MNGYLQSLTVNTISLSEGMITNMYTVHVYIYIYIPAKRNFTRWISLEANIQKKSATIPLKVGWCISNIRKSWFQDCHHEYESGCFFFSNFQYVFHPKKPKTRRNWSKNGWGRFFPFQPYEFPSSHTGSPIDRLATEPLGAQPTPTYRNLTGPLRWTWKFQQISHHNVCCFFCGRLIHGIFSKCTLAWA